MLPLLYINRSFLFKEQSKEYTYTKCISGIAKKILDSSVDHIYHKYRLLRKITDIQCTNQTAKHGQRADQIAGVTIGTVLVK